MKKVYVLYNPYAKSNTGKDEAKKLDNLLPDRERIYVDITKTENYNSFFASLCETDDVVISGGDGTLSRFANDIYGLNIKRPIYYFASGTGNDFAADLGKRKGEKPFLINEYIAYLPVVTIKGKSYRFLNGIGFGIDGYACEEGDKKRNAGKKINYAKIVIKGLLYAFKPRTARITVDGKEYEYKNVWFAPTMKGRFYGGGFKMAPDQNRKSGKVTSVTVHTANRFLIFPLLPSAIMGRHVKIKKYVTVLEGENITVRFNMPTALQVDGETFLNVEEYSVKANAEALIK